MSKPTAKELQISFYEANSQRYQITAPNIYLDWEFNEMDICAVRKSGFIDEVEIKLSKSDFNADFKKTIKIDQGKADKSNQYKGFFEIFKHDAIEHGICHCNRFSFLMPEEIVDKCDIPEYAGLYVYKTWSNGHSRIVESKSAPLLHRRKITDDMKHSIGRKMAYRYWDLIRDR